VRRASFPPVKAPAKYFSTDGPAHEKSQCLISEVGENPQTFYFCRIFLPSANGISIFTDMRRLTVLSIFLAAISPAFAENWTTADGKTYKNVTILYQEADGVRVTYDGGVGKLPYYELPLNVQKRLGEDIDTLEAKKRAADLALAQRNAMLAAQKLKEVAAVAAKQRQQQLAAEQAAPKPVPVAPVVHIPPPPPLDPYPGAKYSYNSSLDSCFLDSYPIDISSDSASNAPGGISSVVLQIVSDGRKPEAPSQVEAVFLSSTSPLQVADSHDADLIVDGTRTPLQAKEKKDANFFGRSGAGYMAFDLTPDQARSFANKNVAFTMGGNTYKIDPTGFTAVHRFVGYVDSLPPAPSSLLKLWDKFIAGFPPITTMITNICEDIILGGFALVVFGFIGAFALGAIRFLNI
jgi:nucleotide-binding universal stress UspA family protein